MNKTVIVTNSISGGGAERSMNLLANALFEQGESVSLIAINKSGPDAVLLKCPVIEINRVWNGSLLNTINSWLKFQKMLIKLGADTLILNCDLPEFYGALSITRSKIICIEHSNNPWYTRSKLGKIVRKILAIKKVTWVTVSDFFKIWPSGSYPKAVIPNSIWQEQENLKNYLGPIKRLVFIGRFAFEKNPKAFLDISKETNIPALMLGVGPEIGQIERLIQSHNINVELKGFVQNPWEFVTNGDLLLVPSRWEGDGLVVLEALQRKVPIIISSIDEFKRFQLPDINYAADVHDFVRLIEANIDKYEVFKVNSEAVKQILSDRNPQMIYSKWISLIDSLNNGSLT
jgi:glycosyltransferase involved in cell wall biosynthesis